MVNKKHISQIKSPASLTDRVHEKLENAILNLELEPGHAIHEQELAEQLGISLTPIREAINRLIGDGFLVRKNRTTKVIQFSINEIEDLCEVRDHLEALAVEKAISNVTPEDIEDLKKIKENGDKCMRSNDKELYEDYNIRFHSKICSMSKNKLLTQLMGDLMKKNRLVMSSQTHTTTLDRRAGSHKEHIEIVDLIEKRDTEKVKEKTREHIYSANRRFINIYLESNKMNSDEMKNNQKR